MLKIRDRRRHARMEVVCPTRLRDKAGRIVFKGRSVDVGPCGVKMIGPPPASVSEGMDVWLEMNTPAAQGRGSKSRKIKVRGYVRRVVDIGQWKSIIVVVMDSNLDPYGMLTGA